MRMNSLVSIAGISLLLLAAAFIGSAPQGCADDAAPKKAAAPSNEVPVGPVVKNRPQEPSGTKVVNSYPEGFLTLSEPSVLSTPEEKPAEQQPTADSAPSHPANWAFLIGTITSIALFLVVAWTDHTYRIRLQSIVAQNNRLLNGEDVDLVDDAPAVGIPLFLGTSELIGDDYSTKLNELLSEPSDTPSHTETIV